MTRHIFSSLHRSENASPSQDDRAAILLLTITDEDDDPVARLLRTVIPRAIGSSNQ